MKLFFILVFASVVFSACSDGTEEPSICDCLAVSDKLDKFTSGILEKGTATPADEAQAKKLRTEKNTKCKAFEMMGGKEMLELKKKCK